MKKAHEVNEGAEKDRKGKEPKPKGKRKILWFILGLAVLLLAIAGVEAYRILYMPRDLFNPSTMSPSTTAPQNATPLPTPEPEGTEGATASPAAQPSPVPTPGITESKDILNILLIGIDGTAEDGGSAAADPHADVQMIVAINFKEKKADLISLPRDTFIYNPDLMDGVYKLNATFKTGGGFADRKAAFEKVCRGAEYMLGGIPVDYYYAVDFEAVVKLVDAIGGVDFDVDNLAYSRQKKTGMQHMDGQDVLYFIHIRNVGPEKTDLSRINRQKQMLVAVFTQLKEKGKLAMLPELISAVNSGVYTNTNLEQTLALVNFAKSIDPKNIGMHSMDGNMLDELGLRWCFTDQKKRQELIRQVYGIGVPEQVRGSDRYAKWLGNYGFKGMVYLKTAKPVLDYAQAHKAELTAEQQKAYDELNAEYAATQAAWDLASLTFKDGDNRAMADAEYRLKTGATSLAKLLGYKETLKWTYDARANNWIREKKINAFPVDFK